MSELKPSEIEAIVRQFESGDLVTLEVRVGESELFLSRQPGERPSWAGQAGSPMQARPAAAPASETPPSARGVTASSAPVTAPSGHVIVHAPSMGTFYRAEKPGAPPFVEVGQDVTPDSELCLIEVMKLFTTLRAGMHGKVSRIFVADATPIEFGQPLFLIDTNG